MLQSTFSACQEVFSHCREPSHKGKSMERDRDRKQEKENIFGAVCCRSKTWQSHDQRHLIILELYYSFNPSESTIIYWGVVLGVWGGGHCQGGNRVSNAVTSCWKCNLLNVAWPFWCWWGGRQNKASLCVWRVEAELMELETQTCHKSLSTQYWIVLLFFRGLVREVGLLNVTRLLYTTSGT